MNEAEQSARPLGELASWTPDDDGRDTYPPTPASPAERALGQLAAWPAGRERGSGTVWALGLGGLLVVAGLVASGLAGVIATTQRVDSAADLAALSGARLLTDGHDAACARARTVAAANDAELTSCGVTDTSIEIGVEAETGTLFGVRLTVRSRARAGPQMNGP